MMGFFAALLIAQGALAPSVTVVDQLGRSKSAPSAKKPVLVIYEDQDGGKENQHAKQVIGRINSSAANQAKIDVLPVANLEKWDWWPARKYALADIRKKAAAQRTTIYLDWKGQVRKAWDLPKGHSSLILLGTDGKVRFSSEGELSAARLKELLALLASLGLAI